MQASIIQVTQHACRERRRSVKARGGFRVLCSLLVNGEKTLEVFLLPRLRDGTSVCCCSSWSPVHTSRCRLVRMLGHLRLEVCSAHFRLSAGSTSTESAHQSMFPCCKGGQDRWTPPFSCKRMRSHLERNAVQTSVCLCFRRRLLKAQAKLDASAAAARAACPSAPSDVATG